MSHPGLDPRWVEVVLGRAAQLSGFRPEAIPRELLERAMLAELEQVDPASLSTDEVLARLLRHTVVGETFFFRQPEHFALLPDAIAAHRSAGPLRVWSAGCATGEEAYALSAYLLGECGPLERAVEVLGTDLLAENLAVAERGSYGRWSVRPSAPMSRALFEEGVGPPYRVRSAVRSATRFLRHNLLEPAPGGPYDVIFCRNVLVYFTAESAARAMGHLVGALAPGGLLCFGPMDLAEVRPSLPAVGSAELNAFRRPLLSREELAGPARPQPTFWKAAVPAPVELHLRALALLEQGELGRAREELSRLAALAPEYLAGAAELALCCDRLGEGPRAVELMQALLERTHHLSPEALVPGPEPLTVAYYRRSAQAFLARKGERR